MKEIDGDLLDLFENETFDVIAHGCNCFNTFGAGIAKKIKDRWPAVYDFDKITIKGDFNKLGNIQEVLIDRKNSVGSIYNCYTQYRYGNDCQQYINYGALSLCIEKLFYSKTHSKIGIPMIGAGLGGGEYQLILSIIIDLINQYSVDCTIVHKEFK